MKKLSTVFFILAAVLSDIMCAVVAYYYRDMIFQIEYKGTSAPAYVAFFYGIPFAIGCIVCLILAIVFRKKAR